MGRKRLSKPKPCPPVTGKYYWEEDKLKLENQAWLPYLTKVIIDKVTGTKKRIGLNPKDIDPEILTAAGHPPKPATHRIKAYLRSLDKFWHPRKDRGIKRVKELCRDCTEKVQDIKDCAIINCPLWNHRLGFNPHNYHKRHEQDDEE